MPQCHSYSSISTFENCPHRYYRTKVLKDIKDDFSGEAATWGNDVHKALENYLVGGAPLGERFQQYAHYAERLGQIEGDKHVERKLAITEEGEPCAFFDKQAAYRGVLDYMVVRPGGTEAILIDHKTGKVRPTKQLHFNALLVFHCFPTVEILRAAFFWLPANSYTKHEFHRDELDALWQTFDATLSHMDDCERTEQWPKKKSGLCGWCPVHDCEHYKPKGDK